MCLHYYSELQVTSILTPVLATAAGESPTKNMWIGCAIALVSTVLITLDSQSIGQDSSALFAISTGKRVHANAKNR